MIKDNSIITAGVYKKMCVGK